MTHNFAGIPIHVNKFVLEGELWLFQPGERAEVMCHEGPQAGESVEIWLKKAKMTRIFPFPLNYPLEFPRVEWKVDYSL